MTFLDRLEQDGSLLNLFAGEVKRDLGIDFFIRERQAINEQAAGQPQPFQFGVLPIKAGR